MNHDTTPVFDKYDKNIKAPAKFLCSVWLNIQEKEFFFLIGKIYSKKIHSFHSKFHDTMTCFFDKYIQTLLS